MFHASEFVHDWTKSCFRYVEPLSGDFTASVNGKEVPVYTCRISKYPLNRVWTGHQRPFDQSEGASFINVESDEPLTFRIRASRPHERVLLKPYSRGIVPEEKDGVITFTLPVCGAYVLETDDYHHCLYIFNNRPIPAPDPASVTYFFGPGVHMPGKITLHSGDSVYVDRDALVFGCLFAENAENIHIFGNGLLDDSGEERFFIHCYEPFTNGNVKFYDCRGLRIEGVAMRNSAIWCVNLFHCFDVVLDGVRVFGQWRYNTDGVDVVNSQDVTIRNSFLHSFDDTVTIKGIDRYIGTDCRNILTENCVLWCDWGKTCEIGLETACRTCQNIVFRSIDILRAGNTALDVQNGDTAEVSDVLFEDIRVEYNSFDTREQYQDTDETVYRLQDTVAIPNLVSISSHPFRTANTKYLWGVPTELTAPVDLDGVSIAGVHDVTVRDVRVYFDERLPLYGPDSRLRVPVSVHPSREGVVYSAIRVSDVTVSGVPMTAENAFLSVDPSVKDFTLMEKDEYRELRKNTVLAENQVRAGENILLENADGTGLRVLFLGNSITLHGVAPSIGWYRYHGMAASAREKDYVHLTEQAILKRDPQASFCICQGADWERSYRDPSARMSRFETARAFRPDVIVMRLIENCPADGFDHARFKENLAGLLSYLDGTGKAKVVLTTGFWRHPGNDAIREFAAERRLPLAELDDLGDNPAMKAVGLFTHTGVANHPGDLGMAKISERILEKLLPMCFE